MKILAFDTSNNSCCVAISEGQTILAYIEDLTPSMQAQELVPMIEKALGKAELSYNDIDYMAVTNGPGSFTGIRIGLAAATGIMLGTDIKCTAVSNFEMSLYRAKQQIKSYDKIVILLNAYRQQLYMQIFEQNSEAEPALLEYEEAVEIINRLGGKIAIAGSGAELIYPEIQHLKNIMILPRFTRIKALHICRYVDDLIKSGKKLQPLEPLYIRPPDAKPKNGKVV
jgi:tRNA threonylcarbamoyl adenosine modification protein YeaZ